MSDQVKVDVLGIIGAEIDRAGDEAFPVGRALIAARDAVAELIDADVKFNQAFKAWMFDRSSKPLFDALCDAADIRSGVLTRIGATP